MTAIHAIERAWERYRLDLTPTDLREICSAIRTKRDAMLMRRSLNTRQVWAVKVRGQWAQVVYQCSTDTIITFLPPAARLRRSA